MNRAAPAQMPVNLDWPAERSIVLRYAAALAPHLATEDLLDLSQGEGARIIELGEHRGVRLLVLDETTQMKSGTYKSLDGCLGVALCRKQGIRRAVFSSGANLGIALTDYAEKTGLETFFFCPSSTLYKFDRALFAPPARRLVAVDGGDRRVKEAARLFAARNDYAHVPPMEWRMLSAGCRGRFIAEQMLERGVRPNWFAQTLCAGYGPIGIYQALDELAARGAIEAGWIPRLLGIQQAGLAPIAQGWAQRRRKLEQAWAEPTPAATIEPALYNQCPDQTYPLLYELIEHHGGDVLAVAHEDLVGRIDQFVAMLADVGIQLTRIEIGGKSVFLEMAGMLAGCGTLKAIDEGRIRRGETVLCALTGGAARAPSAPAVPDFHIDGERPLDAQIEACSLHLSGQTKQSHGERAR